MKKVSFLFIAVIAAIALPLSVSAQLPAGNIRFVNRLSTLQGLTSNDVRQALQDSEGYIWIATREGLCRFDGYRIKAYKSSLYTPGLLSNNRLNVIAGDRNGQIWIGTDNGLNILDKTTETIRQIAPGRLKSNDIQALCVTRNNDVWVGTPEGLYRYFAARDSFALYDAATTGGQFRGHNIKAVYEDYFGNIWVGTWNEGLTRIDGETGDFYSCPPLGYLNSAHVIFEDLRHNIWVITWGNGLVRLENPYDTQAVRYVAYKNDGHPGSLPDNTVYALAQDRNTGRLWVGSRSGLHILNDVNDPHSFTTYLPGQSGLPYNEVNSIICDRTGLMWLGFLGGGVSAVHTAAPVFTANPLDEVKKRKQTNHVRSIRVDDEGVVWMGVGNCGLVTYNPATDRYTFMEENPVFREQPFYSVHHIQKAGHAYWFAAYGQGVFFYRPGAPSGKLRQFAEHTQPALGSNRALYVHEDANRLVWIGTFNGLAIYNPETGEMTCEPSLGMKNDGKQQYVVNQIIQSDRQTLWISTGENGAFRLTIDSVTSKITDSRQYSIENGGLNSNQVQCFFCDSKGRIWIGSHGGGLSLFDPQNDVFVCKHQEYNLPGDLVSNIAEDRQGNLWLGTFSGMVRLKDGKASLFTTADGLPDTHFNPNALFQTPDGEIFIGSHNGYSRFHPDSLRERPNVLPAVITDILIYNRSLETLRPELRSLISPQAAGYTQGISLPYKYNNFSIEFAALNYLNPMQSKYAYKLEGYDREWQYVDAAKRYASYNNLKSGDYTFYLKSLNDNGQWSETKTLAVEILPPFWLTWQAFAAYLALAGLIVFFVLKIVRYRLLLMNEIRIREMEKQQIESLNQERLRFYTNITHELRTPLTLILGPLEDLLGDSKLSACYHSKIKIIHGSAMRLLNLINQILEFRKTETQNRRLTVAKGDLGALVKETGLRYKELNHNEKVQIRILAETDRERLYFDPEIITTILNNLLSNAVKYTPEGEITLRLSSVDEKGETYAEISVSDTGYGISPGDLPRIFDRYYQTGNRHQASGTGIGLALVKALADLHQGVISVESREGEGSIFRFRILAGNTYSDSLHREETPAMPPERMTDENITGKNDDLRPVILVIEDNDDIRNYIVDSLSIQYRILPAVNGKEGLETAQKHIPNIIVSDVMMPGIDGIELCRKIKEDVRTSHIPVILLTAKDSTQDKEEGYAGGADSYLTKPFSSTLLHRRISNLLESRRRLARLILSQAGYVKPGKNVSAPGINKLDEEFLQKTTALIEENISNDSLGIAFLTSRINMAQSTFYLKIKGLTGISPNKFIRKIRLRNSAKLLLTGEYNISEAAYENGFNDLDYFRECFKEEYGMTPTEYLKRDPRQ
ncbi:MAG: response regulator [Tannerellaceae bacterium]|jgi:signal transduction histidine kinase/ligand-binding sensor domain-containing protein/DNA-binding response OmpR family regulator|nr:response regulator [Tannerellaceae bacterium]